MFRKLSLVVLLLSVFATSLFGQKANFELAEKFAPDIIRTMAGDLAVNPNWLDNSDKFWYSYKTSEGKNFYLVDPVRRSKNLIFDNDFMAGELTRLTNKPYNAKDLPLKNLKFDQSQTTITFGVDSLTFSYAVGGQSVTLTDTPKKPVGGTWKNFSPDSAWVVFAKNHNLYLMQANDPDSTEIQLTTDGEKWYSFSFDQSDTSKTKRRGARAGWFKDSKKLYVTRTDNRKVKEFWVINALSQPRPTLETYRMSMPGEEHVPQGEFVVFDVATRNRVNIKAEKWKDQNLGGFVGFGVYTGTGSDKFYFFRVKRTWDEVELCRADTETGEVTVLVNENTYPYFNWQLNHLSILNDGEELLWWSERDGWGHLYLYDGQGNLKNRITQGPYVVAEVASIDTTGRTIYFRGHGKEAGLNPYYRMYYRVGFDGRGLKRLTPEDATHTINMSKSNRFFVNNYSRVDKIPESVLRDSNGNVVLRLETTDVSQLMEAGFKYPEPIKVKAADGITDLYGVMWKPFDFDSTKTYPIITYIYPGPQVEPVPEAFLDRAARYENLSLAQVGFIVVAVGSRGNSPLRSKYYHTYGYDNLRDYALADNKAALEQLANRHSYIDINRVGIYGHSGGGFMSTAAMFVYPDFYKVAVSSAGNHDNNIYNAQWSEIHHGVKEVKKKKKEEEKEEEEKIDEMEEETVFESKVPTNQSLAKNLKGHLLLVHGDIDSNVNPANTTRVVDELIKAGKRFDLLFMPGKRHGYDDYVPYFERMMWNYFAEHLLGDYRPDVDMFKYRKDKKK